MISTEEVFSERGLGKGAGWTLVSAGPELRWRWECEWFQPSDVRRAFRADHEGDRRGEDSLCAEPRGGSMQGGE